MIYLLTVVTVDDILRSQSMRRRKAQAHRAERRYKWFTVHYYDGTTSSDYEGINKRKIQNYHNAFESVILRDYMDFNAIDELDDNRKRA